MTTTTTAPTLSLTLGPVDARCMWYCHVDRSGVPRSPDRIENARSLPGVRVHKGADLELPAWTVIYDVEAKHPTKLRGWDHTVGIVVPAPASGVPGALAVVWVKNPTATHKARIKAADEGLKGGSGPNAAMVRFAAYVLGGADDAARLARLDALLAA